MQSDQNIQISEVLYARTHMSELILRLPKM